MKLIGPAISFTVAICLSACGEREPSTEVKAATQLNLREGVPSLAFLQREQTQVLMGSDGRVRVWRTRGQTSVEASANDLGNVIMRLGADRQDPIIIYADYDQPHQRLLKLARKLNQQGFGSVSLVTPGGWKPTPPPLSGAERGEAGVR